MSNLIRIQDNNIDLEQLLKSINYLPVNNFEKVNATISINDPEGSLATVAFSVMCKYYEGGTLYSTSGDYYMWGDAFTPALGEVFSVCFESCYDLIEAQYEGLTPVVTISQEEDGINLFLFKVVSTGNISLNFYKR